ncbi:MAG TPA: YebC/PmpR family DNA-binding transcriptional regulator [Cyanobacteria bacterium UBA11991]|nr:YebC/PmpR family DNA-binding transcriptional regulator [Cyanobacteriota bacterium]MDY6358566.1 YebC/PmpR family DNA-binding transcriptional regulator [Cyanobacteriota bacterium]MDY6363505.1 YebC/PmpR family DNA-binding transcriptional regulator [Cyanobacteriota bacterium]MDY6383870.1 YebC/PmpR family DNA-binding transcriptional regulator [Cyanobacteriota bacterium]HCB10960.1 YebC/PmpR family DNA-binding transcriptional regulator [Cyanobacteria bacterium UBA11991]
MSGHSKWANIKNKKAKTDSQKAVVFQKYSREIIVAARLGGPDPAGNFRLRTAIEKAKASGLPNDNIKRAIEKGAGAGAGDNYEEITYEGYASGGVAVVVEAMTDNRNRTAGDVRSIFSKFGGNLGETNCVGYMFEKKGVVTFERDDVDFEKLFEAAINLDAEDVEEDEDTYRVITSVENFQSVVEGLEKAGFKSSNAELTRIPTNTIEITDVKTAQSVMRLVERLEELDDVQNVYTNCDIPDEIAQQVEV